MCNAGSGVWIASYLLRVSCLTLEINEFRYYEVKIEESEKAGSRQESNPGYLWLEPPVLCHWATTTWRPLTPTILYLYCTGGTIHFCTCSTDRGLWGLVVSGCHGLVAEYWWLKPEVSDSWRLWLYICCRSKLHLRAVQKMALHVTTEDGTPPSWWLLFLQW